MTTPTSPRHVTCPHPNHFNKPLTLICTNPQCQTKRLLCLKCLTLDHRSCLDHVLEIDDLHDRSFLPNINWIRTDDVKQAIRTVDDYNLTGSKAQLADIFQTLIEKEFGKITEYFIEKIQEKKEKVLSSFRELSGYENINVEEFTRQLQDLYNFDSFLGIIGSLGTDAKGVEDLNKELDRFFDEINSKQVEELALVDMAKRLNSFTRDYLHSDVDTLQKFKDSIKFKVLDGYPLGMRTRSWNPELKSSQIDLLEHNVLAKRVGGSYAMTTVLGSVEMTEGFYRWEMEVATGTEQHQWIVFGICEPNLGKNLDEFNYREAMGLSTFGQFYSTDKVTMLEHYDNKTYLCDLDLYRGVFTISYGGKVIAKVEKGLQNRRFVPFAILSRQGNSVRMKMLTPL